MSFHPRLRHQIVTALVLMVTLILNLFVPSRQCAELDDLESGNQTRMDLLMGWPNSRQCVMAT